jgi:hypothetical protein
LQDGWSAGSQLELEYDLGERYGLGTETLYGRTSTDPNPGVPPLIAPRLGQTIEVASALATARADLLRAAGPSTDRPRLQLRVKAGVAWFGPVGEAVFPEGGVVLPGEPQLIAPQLLAPGTQTTPQLEAVLETTFGRHAFTATASRRIEQSYGVGAIGINRVFSIDYQGQWAPWLAMSAVASDNSNEAPDATPLSSGRSASASFDVTLPYQFAIRLSYSYWDRQDPFRDWRSHTVSAALAKQFAWR